MFKLFRHLAPYKGQIALTLLLIFVQSLTELYLPTLMAKIVDQGVAVGNTNVILQVGALMLGVALIGMVCVLASAFFSARIGTGFGRDLRSKIFRKVESFSLHEFDVFGTATLITRTTNDVTQVQTFVMTLLRMMVSAPLMSIGGIAMAVAMDAELSLVLVAVVPVLVLAVAIIAAKGIGVFKMVQDKLDHLNLVLREGLSGIRVVRAFNRVESEQKRFTQANRDLSDTALRAQRIIAFMMPVMMLVMNLTTIALLWFGGLRLDAGHGVGVGGLMAFLQYAIQILFSLMMVSMMFVMYPRAAVSASRIGEVLDTRSEILDPGKNQAPEKTRGNVEFRDVVFRYPGAEEPALDKISFTANPGQVTAIIGGTGSGKSTLVSLIPRFYDVESGSVLVDGVDVRSMDQSTLREKIGFVPQKAVLFSDTVANNLRFGKETASEEELQEAVAIAQAQDFVSTLPEGLAAPVARGGANLSGGQKQRLSIARALVRKPQIYIFDDSFSALDFKTDAKLRGALHDVTHEATVLIVAQRVNTIVEADRIIVLEDGKIVGSGTHSALIETCSVYKEIVTSQGVSV